MQPIHYVQPHTQKQNSFIFKSSAVIPLSVQLLKGLFPSDTAPVALSGKLQSLYIIHPTKNPEAGPLWSLFSNWSPDAGDIQCSKSP